MVAPVDPKGINRVGAPPELDYNIEAWGFVHGRYNRHRQYLGIAIVVGGGILLVLVAFLLHRIGTTNMGEVQQGQFYRSGQMSELVLADTIHRHDIRTVLRLVGDGGSNRPGFEADVAGTEAAGAELLMAKLPTSRKPWRSELSDLFAALDKLAADESLRPVLVH
jgi:hypothetical protein